MPCNTQPPFIAARNPILRVPLLTSKLTFKASRRWSGADRFTAESSEHSAAVKPEFGDGFSMDGYGDVPAEPEIDYDQESEDEMGDEDEDDDEDYRKGTQEDGMIMMMDSVDAHGRPLGTRQQISAMLEAFARNLDEHSRISFRSFLPDASMLATYSPTLAANPLLNTTTATIFCHFVYVLGPSMSLFERGPASPPGAGLHGPQNVWSYTVPMLALAHPPLLHAILALASLHIAKLTRGPAAPAMTHYNMALRRLGAAIASDRYRGHVAKLAATLMLAYYETMAAEHDKWSSHIHGAKQLLAEIDFARVARGPDADARRPRSRKESDHLRLQADMFWWYAKMDCYQSLLSGCPLV